MSNNHTWCSGVHILCWNKNCSLFPFIFSKFQLLEAREVLQDKDSTIEEREHMIRLVTREKDELARENQVNPHSRVRIQRVGSRFVFQLCFPLSDSQKWYWGAAHSLHQLPRGLAEHAAWHRLTSWDHINQPWTATAGDTWTDREPVWDQRWATDSDKYKDRND